MQTKTKSKTKTFRQLIARDISLDVLYNHDHDLYWNENRRLKDCIADCTRSKVFIAELSKDQLQRFAVLHLKYRPIQLLELVEAIAAR